jgi:ABC-2 type transport system ATP-binding protein
MTEALEKKNIVFSSDKTGITITGSKSDEIGDIAFKAKVRLHELYNRSASLEEAFFELTADAQEYSGQKKGKS